MDKLQVGHYSDDEKGTGLSVFLFEQPAVAAYCLCGSAPASRELSILDLESNVSHIHGLVFSGGSAFGLGATDGVMQWLQEKNRGVQTTHGLIPIVPTACIYDFSIKSNLPPTAENAYQACQTATENDFQTGQIGAGTGATVGKLIPDAMRMTGGLGCAEITLADGLSVVAYAVVNCVGDVYDGENIIAGARTQNHEFANCMQYLLQGNSERKLLMTNTTLVAVFTNAAFSKIELKRIAKIALTGMAHAIKPVFTRYDGDMIFCVSLGEKTVSETVVGALATEAVRQAIVNAVTYSKTCE